MKARSWLFALLTVRADVSSSSTLELLTPRAGELLHADDIGVSVRYELRGWAEAVRLCVRVVADGLVDDGDEPDEPASSPRWQCVSVPPPAEPRGIFGHYFSLAAAGDDGAATRGLRLDAALVGVAPTPAPLARASTAFRLVSAAGCDAAAGAAANASVVVDSFILFNELDLLLLRLRELAGAVDGVLIVEGEETFAGSPKPLWWRDVGAHEPRFAPFLPLIRAAVAPASRGGGGAPSEDDHAHVIARESAQRDYIATALRELYPELARGGRGGDRAAIVLVSDVDEIPSARAVARIRACAAAGALRLGAGAAAPTPLQMRWHVYSLEWRAGGGAAWGLASREASFAVAARAVLARDAPTLTQMRRHLRRTSREHVAAAAAAAAAGGDGDDDGGEEHRERELLPSGALGEAGWHLSAFGGAEALRAKLTEGCCHPKDYRAAFSRDGTGGGDGDGAAAAGDARFARWRAAGVPFYALDSATAAAVEGGGDWLLRWVDARADPAEWDALPRAVIADGAAAWPALFNADASEGARATHARQLALDRAEFAAARAQACGSASPDGACYAIGADQRAATFVASCAPGGAEAAAAALVAAEFERQTRAPRVSRRYLRRRMVPSLVEMAAARCAAAKAGDGDAAREVRMEVSLDLSQTLPLSIDDRDVSIALSPDDDAIALSAQFCETHRLSAANCATLTDTLATMRQQFFEDDDESDGGGGDGPALAPSSDFS